MNIMGYNATSYEEGCMVLVQL